MLIPLDAATGQVVTRDDVKRQLKVQHDEHDALIDDYIAAADEYVGQQCGLVLQPTALEQHLDTWPCYYGDVVPLRCVILAAAPVREVEAVTYIDVDGVEQTVDPSLYRWEPTPTGAELWFVSAFTWPALQCDRRGAVRVLFIAGFNDAEASEGDARLIIPARAKQAVRMLVMHWYENRGVIVVGDQPYPIPQAVDALIDSLRIYR